MSKKRIRAAENAAEAIGRKCRIEAEPIGLILGTGWGDSLELENPVEIPFFSIPGFKRLPEIIGHKRSVTIGKLGEKQVIVLNGRVHLNERPFSKSVIKMVRLQTEMLFQLGVKTIIVTSAVGALKPTKENFSELVEKEMKAGNFAFNDPELKVGQIAVIDGFVSLYAPVTPLWGNEFYSPDNVISKRLMDIALEAQGCEIVAKVSGFAMLRGPQFEGNKYDKALLSRSGAGVVGMSMYPEACVSAIYGAEFLGLGFVTNDDQEIHSHPTNVARGKEVAVHLGEYLSNIIAKI